MSVERPFYVNARRLQCISAMSPQVSEMFCQHMNNPQPHIKKVFPGGTNKTFNELHPFAQTKITVTLKNNYTFPREDVLTHFPHFPHCRLLLGVYLVVYVSTYDFAYIYIHIYVYMCMHICSADMTICNIFSHVFTWTPLRTDKKPCLGLRVSISLFILAFPRPSRSLLEGLYQHLRRQT